ncbi:NUDIX hydrolase [Subtercola boreus]|uniref:NUDIX hydrolase n=1 Tax=Subtercola boreus TaxID=120213 RepID=UPI0015586641|nr:NUDIX domain-containing protein [Subtercola boreus]
MPDLDQPPSNRPGFDFSKSRVLLIDQGGSVLLFLTKAAVPTNPTRWVTPGGHVEPGETHVEAASRELFEETGLRVAPDALGQPIRAREFSDERAPGVFKRNYEEWFVHRTARFEPLSANWTPSEHVDMEASRWWNAEELDATNDAFEPEDLPAVIRRQLG